VVAATRLPREACGSLLLPRVWRQERGDSRSNGIARLLEQGSGKEQDLLCISVVRQEPGCWRCRNLIFSSSCNLRQRRGVRAARCAADQDIGGRFIPREPQRRLLCSERLSLVWLA